MDLGRQLQQKVRTWRARKPRLTRQLRFCRLEGPKAYHEAATELASAYASPSFALILFTSASSLRLGGLRGRAPERARIASTCSRVKVPLEGEESFCSLFAVIELGCHLIPAMFHVDDGSPSPCPAPADPKGALEFTQELEAALLRLEAAESVDAFLQDERRR